MRRQAKISPLFMQVTLVVILLIDCTCGVSYTAVCNVAVNSKLRDDLLDQVVGTVRFVQNTNEDVFISVNLTGFATTDSNTKHGFHVHASDNLTEGCNSLGGHYNPAGVDHGGRDATIRHVGDLGNVEESASGTVVEEFTDSIVKLYGAETVIGRSIVVHQMVDDLGQGGDSGSRATGNAGPRLACCIITRAPTSDVRYGGAKAWPILSTILLSTIISTLYKFV